MGNVLLHLEEGERLDINCTQLLNNEVRRQEGWPKVDVIVV